MTSVTFDQGLTDSDLRGLMRDRPEEERVRSALKLSRRIGAGVMSERERTAAGTILALLAEDNATSVRRAVASTLKNSPHLPTRVARCFIVDLDEIAVPILEHSPVISDHDLIAILRAGDLAKQYAVAGRESLSEPVVDALTEVGMVDSLARVASNDAAEFSQAAMQRALDRFPGSKSLADAFVDRTHLPHTVIETLVESLSDTGLKRLSRRHPMPPSLAVELATGVRADIDLLDQAGCMRDMTRFVQQLQLNNQLTPARVICGLCMGQLDFFEHAMAELAGVSHESAWVMVHDAGPLGLRAIFDRANMPSELYRAARLAIDTYHDIQLEGGAADRRHITRLMVRRVLGRDHDLPDDCARYLFNKLDLLEDEYALSEEAANSGEPHDQGG